MSCRLTAPSIGFPSAASRRLMLLLSLLLAFDARGELRNIAIVRKLGAVGVTGQVAARSTDGLSALVRKEFVCKPDQECKVEIDLPSGKSWQMTAEVPAYGGGGWIPVEKGVLEIWPAATLTGTVSFADEVAPPDVRLRFHAAGRTGTASAIDEVNGETTCAIEAKAFSCEIPAGTVDFSVRARGFISAYRWQLSVAIGARLDIGMVELKRGASLVGQVVSASRDAPKPGLCRVRLAPTANSPSTVQTSSSLPEGTVDPRGFFQLEVIPPGQWDLVVEQEGYAPVRQPVFIIDRAEARLKSPVVLSKPVRLEVTLAPAQDPTGAPWRVAIIEQKGDAKAELVSESAASSAGAWSREGLRASGQYQLRVLTAAGQTWWGDDEWFSPDVSPLRRAIVLTIEAVEGKLTLGGNPLRARVVFGREHSVPSVSLESDQEGKLKGFLPRLGKWTVEVIGESPSVRRRLDVEVRRKLDGDGSVAIALAGKGIQGDIVTEDGNAVSRSILYVSNVSSGEKSSQRIDGGAFQVTGLEPGDYVVSAAGGRLASSDVSVTLSSDGFAEPVRLVMKEMGKIRIRVESLAGVGLVGVPVRIFAGAPSQLNLVRYTDSDGRAEFEAAPSSDYACLLVLAPGYAARIARVSVTTEEQGLQVDQAGGSIVLDYPSPSDAAYPMLGQGDCRLMPALLAAFTRSTDKNQFQNMMAGEYTLCLWAQKSGAKTQGPCKSGSLVKYGNLNLAVELKGGK
jgi:hypothetical protein